MVWGHWNFAQENSRKAFALWENLVDTVVDGPPNTDAEQLRFTKDIGSAESDPHYLGAITAIIEIDHYFTGQGGAPQIYYKTAADVAELSGVEWQLYDGVSFNSAGWAKLRLVKA